MGCLIKACKNSQFGLYIQCGWVYISMYFQTRTHCIYNHLYISSGRRLSFSKPRNRLHTSADLLSNTTTKYFSIRCLQCLQFNLHKCPRDIMKVCLHLSLLCVIGLDICFQLEFCFRKYILPFAFFFVQKP